MSQINVNTYRMNGGVNNSSMNYLESNLVSSANNGEHVPVGFAEEEGSTDHGNNLLQKSNEAIKSESSNAYKQGAKYPMNDNTIAECLKGVGAGNKVDAVQEGTSNDFDQKDNLERLIQGTYRNKLAQFYKMLNAPLINIGTRSSVCVTIPVVSVFKLCTSPFALWSCLMNKFSCLI